MGGGAIDTAKRFRSMTKDTGVPMKSGELVAISSVIGSVPLAMITGPGS